jgi:hypothetical protein
MFFDYWPYEYAKGFSYVTNTPERSAHNPLFSRDPDSRFKGLNYNTVLYDKEEKIFKVWYGTRFYDFDTLEHEEYLVYGTSVDGIKWDFSNQDVVEGTNYVTAKEVTAMGASIIKDFEDEKMPYKLLMRPKSDPNIHAYYSMDGIHWVKVQEEPVLPYDSDCQVSFYRDSETKIYKACFRGSIGNRRVFQSQSKDFIHWTEPVLTLDTDISDGPQVQIYSFQMSQYGNYAIGLSPMYNTEESDMGTGKMFGKTDIKLAFSRGGYNWKWAANQKRFIEVGAEGEFDSCGVYTSSDLVYLDDEIRIYYAGIPYDHGDREGYYTKVQSMGYATLRPDGFTKISCQEKGELLTRPFSVLEPDIYLNCDSKKGAIQVELLEEDGTVIEGFNKENCQVISEDNTKVKVEWIQTPDFSKILKKVIRLKVYGEKADIYSITFSNGTDINRYWEFKEALFSRPLKDVDEDEFFMHV